MILKNLYNWCPVIVLVKNIRLNDLIRSYFHFKQLLKHHEKKFESKDQATEITAIVIIVFFCDFDVFLLLSSVVVVGAPFLA